MDSTPQQNETQAPSVPRGGRVGATARSAGDSAGGQGERAGTAAETGAEQEPDLRDALGQLKEQLQEFVGPESEAAARLVVVQGRASQPAVALSRAPVTLGRDASNTLAVFDALASRRHASVGLEGGAWIIADLQSANGTFVNDQRVSKQALRPGDQIRIGQCLLAFQGSAPAGWKCSQCGRANPAHDRFCGNCGTPRTQGG